MSVRPVALALIVGALLSLAVPAPAAAVTITTFPIEAGAPAGKHVPRYIASSPTGQLWFTDIGTATAVRAIDTAGLPAAAITQYTPTADLGFAPDGTLSWAIEYGAGASAGYASRSPSGAVTKQIFENGGEAYALGFTASGEPRYSASVTSSQDGKKYGSVCAIEGCGLIAPSLISDLTLDSQNHLWALEPEGGEVAIRLGLNGLSKELTVNLPPGSSPTRAALGPDGNLWITGFGNSFTADNTLNQIIRLTPSGAQTSFLLPPGQGPEDITLGPDGALWFTEYISNSIGRITTSGEYSSCQLPNAASNPGPFGITTGADGAIWFTEEEVGAIGRLSGGSCAPVPLAGQTGSDAQAGGGGNSGGSDKQKPVLQGLKLSPAAFKASKGATISFSLSEPSTLKFTVQKKAPGRKVGKSCKPQTRANADGKHCVRYLAVPGSLTIDGKSGSNSFTFKGKLGRRKLEPGGYLLSGQATDGSGNHSAIAAAAFRILE